MKGPHIMELTVLEGRDEAKDVVGSQIMCMLSFKSHSPAQSLNGANKAFHHGSNQICIL